MQSLKVLAIATLMGASALALSSCSSAQKAAAGGGLVGGVAGAIIGNNVGTGGPATGIAVGTASGAAVGGLAGDAYDQVTESDQDRELENLRAELAAKELELAELRNGAPSEQQLAELDQLRTRVAELESQLGDSFAKSDKDAAALADLEQQLAAASNEKGQLQDQLDQLKTNSDQMSQDLDLLRQQKALLEESVRKLDDEVQRLQSLLKDKEATLAALQDSSSQERDKLNGEISALKTSLNEKEAALADMRGKVDVLQTSLVTKDGDLSSLRAELDKLNIKLDETSRGLTMTIVDSLLYNPGSSDLSDSGQKLIGDVATILKNRFPNRELLIEGHTDNQPIVHSGWRSNWELGAARALNILHELVDGQGFDSAKVSATSFGEYRPAAANATPEGRAQNRRAVIVILPEKLPLQRTSLAQAD